MKTTIYIVKGHTGSHDDWETWDVQAYFKKAHANKHAKLCNDWWAKQTTNHPEEKNPYDSQMKLCYRTKWEVETVSLTDEPIVVL